MPELPDLEGQPGWVVVVVVALFFAAGLGATWLRILAKRNETPPAIPPPPDTLTLPGATFDPVQEAMAHLARSAEESKLAEQAAEREADELRAELAACGRELAVLHERHTTLTAKLAACEERNHDYRTRP